MNRLIIRAAHSPDSDDAFMFYALAQKKVDTGEFDFVDHLEDIESLNQAATKGIYEITALSIHGYAYVADRYALLNSGASMGEGYGPIVVARKEIPVSRLRDVVVAVPGERTSAFLALRILEPRVACRVVPFDRILEEVEAGHVDAGLIIHEGQLTYSERGLKKIVDLGEWWLEQTGLPLPLGGNAIRRDLGSAVIEKLSNLLKRSIRYALEHREEALTYALDFGRGLDRSQADKFVGMYVNQRTLDYGEDGRKAVQLFLDKGVEAGVLPRRVEVEFV
ncbi:MAG TPA: ABC transporter substrate-binding protein [Acidobacteriota bacterium]|nr:ABC transporter substrate-binding protein [Acidobacteriota bacterium]